MVKAQTSMEYLMLLALAGVLSVGVLASTSSQFAVQNEFHNNATALLENSTRFNASDPNYNPYSNSTVPRLEIRLSTAQPAYTGQSTVVQAVVYNYGAPATIPLLKIESSNGSLLLSPNQKYDAPVRFSYTLSSVVTPQAAGTYQLKASALDAAGNVMSDSEGKPLNTSVLLTVLQAPTGPVQPPPSASYTLALSKSNESASYPIYSPSDEIYKVSAATGDASDGYCSCPPNPNALWYFSEMSSSGTVYLRCECLYFQKQAKIALISPIARPAFLLKLNATNQTNAVANFEITQDRLSGTNAYGTLSMAALPVVTGANPSPDSVATTPMDRTEWKLRPMIAYNDYKTARNNFEGRIGTGWCSYDCNGALTAAGQLNSKADVMLSAVSPYGCTANSTHISCTPAVLTYNSLQLSLNKSFVGAEIPCNSPESRIVSGINVEVTACT